MRAPTVVISLPLALVCWDVAPIRQYIEVVE
jgi:hypothetical protein